MSTSEEKAAEAKKRIIEKKWEELDKVPESLNKLREDIEKSGKSAAEYILGKEGAEKLHEMFDEKTEKKEPEKKEPVSNNVDLSKADLSAMQKLVFDKTRGGSR